MSPTATESSVMDSLLREANSPAGTQVCFVDHDTRKFFGTIPNRQLTPLEMDTVLDTVRRSLQAGCGAYGDCEECSQLIFSIDISVLPQTEDGDTFQLYTHEQLAASGDNGDDGDYSPDTDDSSSGDDVAPVDTVDLTKDTEETEDTEDTDPDAEDTEQSHSEGTDGTDGTDSMASSLELKPSPDADNMDLHDFVDCGSGEDATISLSLPASPDIVLGSSPSKRARLE